MIEENRAQATGEAKTLITLVIVLMVSVLITAFVLPIGLNALEGDTESTFNQSVGETVEVKSGGFNGTLDDSDGSTINVTITDIDTGNSASTTGAGVAEGDNETLTLEGEDITINNDDSRTSDADITYEYPTDYGWDSSTQSIWGILGLVIVLGIFLAMIGIGLAATNRL